MKIKLIIIFTLTITVLFGQTSTFRWNDQVACTYESTYDSTIYSENQLRNCWRLLYKNEFNIQNIPVVFEAEEIEYLNLIKLDNEFIIKSNKLMTLDLPHTKYCEDLRKYKLIELEQVYKLSRIAYQGYSNPEFLKQFNQTDSSLLIHINSLIAGGDSLLKDWYALISQGVKKKHFSEKIWERYNYQLNSKDKFIYARNFVFTSGWWSNALNHIDRLEKHIDRKTSLEEFEKLFLNTKKLGCED